MTVLVAVTENKLEKLIEHGNESLKKRGMTLNVKKSEERGKRETGIRGIQENGVSLIIWKPFSTKIKNKTRNIKLSGKKVGVT